MVENKTIYKVISELSRIIPNEFLAYEFFLEISRSRYHKLWDTCFMKATNIRSKISIDIRTNNDISEQALGIMCQELMKLSSSALYDFIFFFSRAIAGTGRKRFQ